MILTITQNNIYCKYVPNTLVKYTLCVKLDNIHPGARRKPRQAKHPT